MLPCVISSADSRQGKPSDSISFIEQVKKRARGEEENAVSSLEDFAGLARVVVELDRVRERGGKRLCAFQQSGPCHRTLSVS